MKTTGVKKGQLTEMQSEEILSTLKVRFETNMHRHKGMLWSAVVARIKSKSEKLWSLYEMERTGGEPDVVGQDKKSGEYIFYDCSAESPKGRRSLCYDRAGLDARKEHKPKNSAVDVATNIGVDLLTEEEYRELQTLGKFDTATSSWIQTPPDVRTLGGALCAEFRYGRVFVGHNSAPSYYAARGFRGVLRV